ncbi:MAG: oxidoreductase [Nitrospina sp.]|jgi:NAD(P)H-flavin reductase|nr:oxidoreductase [Nitrospina sp.]MBT6600945.1 oxidoreductase [Nitrospina sp.]
MFYKVLNIRSLSPSTYILRLERKKINFKPGQCFNIGLKASGINREYSIYSGINEPYLEFLIKEVQRGSVSSALRKANPGEEVDLHGPYGSFVVSPDEAKHNLFTFIATGTGIAPFHSFIRTYPNIDYRIINGIRTAKEQYDYGHYNSSRLTTCISRDDYWNGFKGRVTDYLKTINIDSTHIYFLCGNQNMIQESYELLRVKGVSGNQIFTEAFF